MERIGLAVLRKNMKVFIDADYREIILQRPKKRQTNAGSWVEDDPDSVAPQRFRLIPAKRRLSEPAVDSQDGEIPYQAWTMIGTVDADVQRDDEFVLNGVQYKVKAVSPDTDEREFADRVVIQLETRQSGD